MLEKDSYLVKIEDSGRIRKLRYYMLKKMN